MIMAVLATLIAAIYIHSGTAFFSCRGVSEQKSCFAGIPFFPVCHRGYNHHIFSPLSLRPTTSSSRPAFPPEDEGSGAIVPPKIPIKLSWTDDDDEDILASTPRPGPTDYDPEDARRRDSGERDVFFLEYEGDVDGTADAMRERHLSATGGLSTFDDAESHVESQRLNFDEMSDFFGGEAREPDRDPDVSLALRHIVKRVVRASSSFSEISGGLGDDMEGMDSTGALRFHPESLLGGFETESEKGDDKPLYVLDVGCGAGALFPHYAKSGRKMEVLGVDLSERMVEQAKVTAHWCNDKWAEGEDVNFDVVCADFVANEKVVLERIQDEGGDDENKEERKFDAVVINACFGNFFDLDSLLATTSSVLGEGGILAITHPLGSDFVKSLHEADPGSVPHNLPDLPALRSLLRHHPLNIVDFVSDGDVSRATLEGDAKGTGNPLDRIPLYYAAARRVPHRALKKIMRFRGPVATGYGRGGKALGVPTANLPASAFGDALLDFPTGVYFGWAVIESGRPGKTPKKGRATHHRAVVNVGFSPTFEGKENAEKIVEAHLIVDEGDILGDFYNETMRLSLVGQLRGEKKFPSFPALKAAIENDIINADDALDAPQFAALRADPFLVNVTRRIGTEGLPSSDDQWIGIGGGNETASWEQEVFVSALENCPLGKWVV
uniref:riboflavin kinase n=1 Tax=Corethron hystrix TaxID=216773 RepID=A0A7S1FTC5_9STRA|mmetsp:Transcript_30171/g.69166  ORF Transcript_30171/g.69166 Transcript_30171/m.69166 type:complete len:667 (+) Transcript_30171:45-2045(+)